jgi:uncharacterized cupredoxin-like copper-binding protein
VPLALSTGHEVGLGVTAAAFIIFALASSFLFPRLRPDYPGRGLLAFVVVAFLFFFGMLAAVETFGAESKKPEAAAPETTTSAAPQGNAVVVDESEFKIVTSTTTFKAGQITFEAKNVGKIAHDLAIKQTGEKTKLIQPGASATLTVTLKPGTYELYCTVPGHEAAGMRLNITVTSSANQPAPPPPATSTKASTTTAKPAKPQASKVAVSETEFKITLASTTFKAGQITFEAKNVGKIPHDLAIKQTGAKTKLIQPGASATLTVTLKPGTYELYCTVPGHEAAGMRLNITVTSSANQPAAPPPTSTKASTTTTATPAKPQATKVAVSETEFKITLAPTTFKAGKITFQVKNDGKIPHDLAIKQKGDKTKLIQAGGTAELTVTLKAGTYELYCTVPGHEAAGMKQNITVT